MTEQQKKGRSTKESEKLKHLRTKIQEAISNIVITEKNEKLWQTTGHQEPKVYFQINFLLILMVLPIN